MNPDQSQPAPEADVSPEVAEYFGIEPAQPEDQTPEAEGEEKVNSEGQSEKKETEDKKTDAEEAKEDEGAQPDEEPEEDPDEGSEDEPEEGADDGEPDEEDDPDKLEFLIAGQKVEGLEKAIEKVNSIAGDNTRLAGDIKSLESEVSDLNDKLSDKDETIAELKGQLEGLEGELDDNEEDKPLTSKNLDEAIDKALKSQDKKKSNAKREAEVNQQIDDLKKEKDYTIIYPVMLALAEKIGQDGLKNLTPKELYDMARGQVATAKTKQVDEGKKKIDNETKKNTAKNQEAKKGPGGNNKKTETEGEEEELSPEIDDYFKNKV